MALHRSFYLAKKKIEQINNELGFSEGFTIVDCSTKLESIEKAVKAVSLKDAEILMKGNVKTGSF